MDGAREQRIRVRINGADWTEVSVRPEQLLIELLRDDLRLTGTKEGCSVGVCGACSVIVDDALVSSCLMPAIFVDGSSIRTIEGVTSSDGRLAPLQQAFIEHGGFQCGICTPGQIVAATALLEATPHPTAEEIRRWMMGNLCRCTGYHGIVRSIAAAAARA